MIRMLVVFALSLLMLLVLIRVVLRSRRKRLYVRIDDDGSVKLGTCQHCVVREKKRPNRAWPADGDRALDFPRDRLLQRLAPYGLQVEIEQEYVCP
ncbi:hypothetical protein [Ktedonospora formicarum]|uniref:Uncharacterized protein n=1 Tax=Ktedonospora formicarum TaxID=2778364 RepID=A0A8J3IBF6_9CHLR|nr:hypothetical protein [Ktedonospora formicarum]GHO50858.1 hypothetical protein KSX_90210 [Ktedonospora formicarum]